MNILIQEKLKSFRREKENTQEELAAHLGISIQAVSKWERGEGYPDIMLLPAIAAFYNVTVDDLLGVGELEKQRRMEEYEEKNMLFLNQGKIAEGVQLWRDALSEFPNSLEAVSKLMNALFWENAKDNAEEIIAYGEKILRKSTDNHMRDEAIQCLCHAYKEIGNVQRAKECAQMAGGYYITSNELLPEVLPEDEAVEKCQDNIMHLIALAAHNANVMINKGNLLGEDAVKAIKFALGLWEHLFEDGNYGFFHRHAMIFNMQLAHNLAELGKVEETLEAVEEAAKHALRSDAVKNEKYTAFMVNRCCYDSKNWITNHRGNYASLQLNMLKDECFDGVREEARFKAVWEKLEKKAK